MKLKKMRLFLLFGLLFLLAVLVGCASTGSGSGDNNPDNDRFVSIGGDYVVNFDSDPEGLVTVNNNLPENIVLFAGQIVPSNLLGGLRGGEGKKVDLAKVISPGSGAVLLRAVLYEKFAANPGGISADDVVWYKLIPSSGEMVISVNSKKYEQQGGFGLDFKNASEFMLEIRRDSPSGPVLTVLPPHHYGKKTVFFPTNDEIVYFPVYYTYNAAEDEIVPFKDIAWGEVGDFANPEMSDYPVKTFSGIEGVGVVVNKVVLRIRNIESSGKNAKLISGGQTEIENQRGITTLRSGKTETYAFDVEKDEEALIFSGYRLQIGLDPNDQVEIPRMELRKGYRYQLEVNDSGVEVLNESEIEPGRLELVNES